MDEPIKNPIEISAVQPQGAPLSWPRRSLARFRRAVILGLAVVLPPVLTIVILLWAFGTVRQYVLTPVEDGVREFMVWKYADIYREPRGSETREPILQHDGKSYHRLAGRENLPGEYIPSEVYTWLRNHRANDIFPTTGTVAYRQYIQSRYLQPSIVVPVFICLFTLFLYFLGKLLALETWGMFERAMLRLPLVRWVYATVKRVTDFVFIENQKNYKRVVAVEYPREGIWSIGMVTGDGVGEVDTAANESTVTVILPGSPTPITGYCVMVPASETHDLHMTIDQALQFYMSCGVVVPAQQYPQEV